MTGRFLAMALGGAGALGAVASALKYRRDIALAGARVEDVVRRAIETPYGTVEYAERGTGDPVLVSHGIFHGCDGGLASVEDTIVGRRVIVPSRFGYLGSSFPPAASTSMQADAFVALLDHLHLAVVDVIAVSAGTTAAVQLALHHPDRVNHLVISSGNLPGSGTATAPPGWARVFYSDAAMWALKQFAPPLFGRLMGVPTGFPRNDDEARVMSRMAESIFPISPRVEGAIFDAYVANPEIATCPLELLRTPTLLVHSTDDPLASYEAAANAAARIPGARLVSLDSGGHLQLGQAERVRDQLDAFLSTAAQPTFRD